MSVGQETVNRMNANTGPTWRWDKGTGAGSSTWIRTTQETIVISKQLGPELCDIWYYDGHVTPDTRKTVDAAKIEMSIPTESVPKTCEELFYSLN